MNKGGDHSVGRKPVAARESSNIEVPNLLATAGFTIVETLIVLAVTAVLFTSAVLLINGRQAKTQFQTGINGARQSIQQIINETASGYFPDSGSFHCQGSSGTQPVFTAGADTQGTSDGCIFVGKVIQFGPSDSASASSYEVYPLAGNRRDQTGKEVGALYSNAGALPRVVYAPPTVDLTTAAVLDGGLTLVKSSYTGTATPGGTGFAGIGFITSFGSYTDSANVDPNSNSCSGLCSGSQQLGLYVVPNIGLSPSVPKASAIADINASPPGGLVGASQVQLCFASGTTNQSGLITIDSQLTVNLSIKDGLTC